MKKYHGWIVTEQSNGMKDQIWVEYHDHPDDAQRKRFSTGFGNSGAASAVEWWDKKVGESIKLEPLGVIGYRVYTEVEA